MVENCEAKTLRIALAQLNAVVGDLDGNRDKILDVARARRGGRRRPRRLPRARGHRLPARGPPAPARLRPRGARRRSRRSRAPRRASSRSSGRRGSTATSRTRAPSAPTGEIQAVYRKQFLPNYGVFDEHRYFAEGRDLLLAPVRGRPRRADDLRGRLAAGPARDRPRARGRAAPRQPLRVAVPRRQGRGARGDARHARARHELVPRVLQPRRRAGRARLRRALGRARRRGRGRRARARLRGAPARRRRRARRSRSGAGCATCAGASSTARARPLRRSSSSSSARRGARARPARPATVAVRARARADAPRAHARPPRLRREERVRGRRRRRLRRHRLGRHGRALRRRARRRSACTASRCRRGSRRRGRGRTRARLAENLGCDFREIPIEDVVEAFHDVLREPTGGGPKGSPPRTCRRACAASLLMALSNTYGWLVVSTGNKSELAVGYSTLYGDMVGGFSLLKDVFKTDVFRLARYLNERAGRELVPVTTIERAPSAELRRRPARRGLDPAVRRPRPRARGVRRARPLARGAARGVRRRASSSSVLALVDRAEYKRRQAPPGVKLRPKAFGRDRRTPITNRWQGLTSTNRK